MCLWFRFSVKSTAMSCDWTIEETTLLIQKRLEMFGGARNDRVYDQISDYLMQKHNIYKNASACQSRFNNALKTYRLCVKRVAAEGGKIRKMRFPFFDIFHQFYAKAMDKHNANSKCKSEILLDDIFEDSSYAGDSMMYSSQTNDEFQKSPDVQNEYDGDSRHTTSLTMNNGLNDLKLRLMEQKLLYYTNQNLLLEVKQEHYRRKEQERGREQLTEEEIPTVLRRIRSCLVKSRGVKIVPMPSEKVTPVKVEKQPMNGMGTGKMDGLGLVTPIEVDAGEEEENDADEVFNGDAQSATAGSSKEVIKKPVKARLKVRKNIFPAWNRVQTVLLIKIHCDLRPKFKGHNLFESISNKLIELHINRTPRDCRTRWNNLFRSYKECRSRLKLNVKAAVKFEYFNEIDAYYKDQQFLAV